MCVSYCVYSCPYSAWWRVYLVDVGVPVLVMSGPGLSAVDAGEEGRLGEVHARRVQAKGVRDHPLDAAAHVSVHANGKGDKGVACSCAVSHGGTSVCSHKRQIGLFRPSPKLYNLCCFDFCKKILVRES